MNDWELLTAFVQGDEQALDSLIQKYFPTVYAAAVRQVGDPHLAQDVAQSVFILFSRKAARLSRDVLVGGWLLRTTRFVSRDALKQRNRRIRREEQAAQLAYLDQPQAEPDWTALAPWVDDALASLSGKEQACVIARFIEGRSLRQIGQEYRISEDAAQKRVSRSLEKMRSFLQRHGVKAGVATLAALLSTELVKAADSRLVESAIQGVHAALHGGAVPAASIQLANATARALLRHRIIRVLSLGSLTATLLITGFVFWRDHTEPAVPSAAPFVVSDPRIAMLAAQWGQLDVRASTLMRAFSPPPAPNDPRFAAFQRELTSLSADGDRIHAAFLAIAPGGGSPSQRAEFLTLELKQTANLSSRQQAAVHLLLRSELSGGATPKESARALLQDKAVVGRQIRDWLSPSQRRRFNFTYREDFLSLFTFVKLD